VANYLEFSAEDGEAERKRALGEVVDIGQEVWVKVGWVRVCVLCGACGVGGVDECQGGLRTAGPVLQPALNCAPQFGDGPTSCVCMCECSPHTFAPQVVEVTHDERGPKIGCSIKLVDQGDGADLDPQVSGGRPQVE
jgi:hypothetical protein